MRQPPDDPRRRLLLQALAAGAFLPGPLLAGAGEAGTSLLGRRPEPLPEGRSFHDLEGEVRVNGRIADARTAVQAGDRVETGPGARAVFVIGRDAFLLRAESSVQTESGSAFVRAMRIATGALLSVFGERRKTIHTSSATIGIRGTGMYVESEPDRSYVCTCYGIADIAAAADPSSKETVESEHHDAPRYVLANGTAGERIRTAPFKNHDDAELALLEALVGREPPFGFSFDRYDGRRRGYTQ